MGAEKQGAPRAADLTRRPLCPHEKNKGKRAPSMKTRGAWHPAAPWGSGGVDLEEFLAAVGELERLQKRQKEEARGREEAAGKGGGSSWSRPEKQLSGSESRGKSKRPRRAVAGWLDLERGRHATHVSMQAPGQEQVAEGAGVGFPGAVYKQTES